MGQFDCWPHAHARMSGRGSGSAQTACLFLDKHTSSPFNSICISGAAGRLKCPLCSIRPYVLQFPEFTPDTLALQATRIPLSLARSLTRTTIQRLLAQPQTGASSRCIGGRDRPSYGCIIRSADRWNLRLRSVET